MTQTKNKYKIGKFVLPGSFQTAVIMRFMVDGRLKDFFEEYQGAKLKEHNAGEPTELDFAIAENYKRWKNPKKAAKKFKCTTKKVSSAVRKVAIWTFLNK